MAERGCGTRKAGGIYLVCSLSRDGLPIEDFLKDPPLPVSEGLGLTAIGQTFLPTEYDEKGAIVRPSAVLDWVGEQFYPNVADFIEEVRRMGLSRRMSSSFDFSQIGPQTRIMMVHRKAIIKDPEPYHRERKNKITILSEQRPYCPKWAGRLPVSLQTARTHTSPSYRDMCAGLWWEDLVDVDERDAVIGIRKMPSFSYFGYTTPKDAKPEYEPGIFMVLPALRIEVVRDPENGLHEKAMEKALHADVAVTLVDE